MEYIESKNIKNYHKEKYNNEGTIFFPLFNKEIQVYVDFDVDIDYAEKCVEYLSVLSDKVIADLCKGSILYCEDICEKDREYLEACKINIPVNVSGRKILEYVNPTCLVINKPEENKIGFEIECDCIWENEHGLMWIIKEDKVLYVGPWGGCDTWSDEDYLKTAPGNYMSE